VAVGNLRPLNSAQYSFRGYDHFEPGWNIWSHIVKCQRSEFVLPIGSRVPSVLDNFEPTKSDLSSLRSFLRKLVGTLVSGVIFISNNNSNRAHARTGLWPCSPHLVASSHQLKPAKDD